MKWLFLLFPLLQGCGVGMLMAGSGANKAGTARVMESYTTYVLGMERLNFEREKAGLPVRTILSKAEWLEGKKSPAKNDPHGYQEGEDGYEDVAGK